MSGACPPPGGACGPPGETDAAGKPIYRCGTLTYTRLGLFALFAWLLWGDFCYTIMEAVVPNILPLKLKDLGASNTTIAIIMSTLPGVLNMTICPWVSFVSDRHRGRWGRRIPFILWTLPFIGISLAMIGYSEEIATWLRSHSAFAEVAPATVTIAVIGVFATMFQFFNMFVSSVFWYLFNDVVPAQFLGRFYGFVRIVGTLGSALYTWFLFEHGVSHMREIMVGAAILYVVGFGVVCFMVKEGDYPPVDDAPTQQRPRGLKARVAGVVDFFRQSFSDRLYLLQFGITGLAFASAQIMIFNPFFQREMGLVDRDIGHLQAITMGASLLAMYVAAVFVDRWHPMRVSVYLALLGVAGASLNWVWLFATLPGEWYFYLTLGIGLVAMFQNNLNAGAGFPRDMRLFPRSRFGQFCAAQALFRSGCTLVAGLAAGAFMDFTKTLHPGSEFGYRYIVVWQIIFVLAGAVLAVFAYRRWYALGGDGHYRAPAPWSPSGFEDAQVVHTVGPSRRWLSIALHLLNGLHLLTLLLLAPLVWWMDRHGLHSAVWWHVVVLLPGLLIVWCCWKMVERGIRADMAREQRGEPLHQGLLHHGPTLVIACTLLLELPFWLMKVGVSARSGDEPATVVFTISVLVTNLLITLGVWILRRVERGHLNKLDCDLATVGV
jgi:maltose/moltooligosaccharide transporter